MNTEQSVSPPSVILGNILLVCATLVLPGTGWYLFGWLHLVTPLLVFFLLCKYGMQVGTRYIVSGFLPAVLIALFTGTLGTLLFAVTLIPCGYVLAQSAKLKESPCLSGLKASGTLMLCWLLLIGGEKLLTGVSPLESFSIAIGTTIDEIIKQQQGQGDAEALLALEVTLTQMKRVIPIILPGILLSGALFSTLVTMVVGNRLVKRHCNKEIWPNFTNWKLPDQLIWAVIIPALLALLPIPLLRHISANLIILLITVYSFQGFSICVFYMNKWNVPILLRAFLYVMVIFQTFGTLVLIILGVFDTWFDFRKLSLPNQESPSQ